LNEDKATRYHRLSRRSAVLGVLLSTGFLAALVLTGGSAALRDLSLSLAGRAPAAVAPAAAVAAFVFLLAPLHEILTLPLAFYRGHVLERRYGLSVQTSGRWLRDHVKSGAIGVVLGIGAAEIVYALMNRFPRAWWAVTAAVLALVVIVLARLAPVVLLPLFYRFTPLDREALRERLVSLARKTGARVVGAYEWKLSDRTSRANAALTGLGSTRRIILSDTLLEQYSDEEIEVILAHELAHHVHRDIWSGIAYETALLFAGLYGAHTVLGLAAPRLGLGSIADLAGLPVVLLTAGGISLVLMPAANALSRAHEYRADRFALDVTRNPGAFISAMKRLGAQNLAEERPSRLVEVLFHTHPPLARRIAAAHAWSASGVTTE
jgi:Zn-dependent protease with chaperone function